MSSTSNSSSSGSRWARTKTKTFLESNGQNLFRTVEKSGKNQTVWSQQSSKKKLKMPHFNHLPRPGEINPYIPTSKGVSWGNGHVNPLLFLEQAHLHLLPPISTSSRPDDHRSENISWVKHSLLSAALWASLTWCVCMCMNPWLCCMCVWCGWNFVTDKAILGVGYPIQQLSLRGYLFKVALRSGERGVLKQKRTFLQNSAPYRMSQKMYGFVLKKS